ncbi:IclR family transcriptional regulator [Gordonia sp. NPDC003376]
MTDILEYVARSSTSVRLADLVNALNAPRSSVHGLVHGLVSTGYLQATDDGRYMLGPAVSALLMHKPMDRGYRSAMEALSLEFDETVTLVVIAGDSFVTTDAIESSKAVRYHPTIGIRRPLYPTSAGKCFLANATPEYQNKYLQKYFPSDDDRNVVRADLSRVKADGFAINTGDTLPDLSAVSVPLFTGSTVSAVITIAGPSSRFTDRLDDIVRGATATAAAVSSD